MFQSHLHVLRSRKFSILDRRGKTYREEVAYEARPLNKWRCCYAEEGLENKVMREVGSDDGACRCFTIYCFSGI